MTRPRVAYQGEPGSNSYLVCTRNYAAFEPLPCASFEDVFGAVDEGRADLALIPIDNSLAGRVADIHHLLPRTRLHIVAEHFLPIQFSLMGTAGSSLETVRTVRSHVHALGQCRRLIRDLGLNPHVAGDTAGAAREIADSGDPTQAAIAPPVAASMYGLRILLADVQDEHYNATRFVELSNEARRASLSDGPVITTLAFRVLNLPAALYKALGGFATNGVNMTKLESYMLEGHFTATQFLADVDGHPYSVPLGRALDELRYYTTDVRILGVYRADPYRIRQVPTGDVQENASRPVR